MSALLRPDRFLLLAGLLCGAAFAIITPPFEVPDEPAHFARAYRVSEGWLDLAPQAGRTGAPLPASVQRITTDLVAGIPFHPERKIAPAAIRAALRIPLEPAQRAPFFFPNSLQYTFVPYIPQALGIAAGRLCGAPPLVLLYLARLMNLACGVLVLALAVRRLPAYRWLAALVGLTPMALALLASASADVTTLAASFTLVSVAARLAWGSGERARRSDLALLTAGAMVLCAAKPPYLPLLLLAFLVPAARFAPGWRVRFLLLHTVLSLAMAAWSIFNAHRVATFRLNAGIDAGRQIHDSLLRPWRFLGVMAFDYGVHAPRYLAELVGNLGWLDTRLPKTLVIVYLAVLLALVLLDTEPPGPPIDVRPWQRGIVAVAVLAALTLISASQYAVWTPYGAGFIAGLQGRYFLPLLPAAAWALYSRRAPRWTGRLPPERLDLPLAAFSLLSLGIAMWTLAGRYYGV